jgi:hypothetical protein
VEKTVVIWSTYALEGILHLPDDTTPRAGVVVCHPHPLYGGNLHFHLVRGIARACAERGMAALRFNFRGVGDSGGEYDGGVGEVEDTRAALSLLRGQVGARGSVGLAGYSFGSLVAARHAAEEGDVAALALVAFAVSTDLFEPGDFAGLGRIRAPLLIVSGGRDRFAPPEAVNAALDRLEVARETIVYPGADHFFGAVSAELAARVADFFAGALLPAAPD